MPGKADGQKRKPTFNTTEREESFKRPPKHASTYPILNEFVTPHIESFNALFDDSGLPKGDGDGKGLLSIALKDIGERVVFDGTGQIGTESGQAGWGNRLSCELTASTHTSSLHNLRCRQSGLRRYPLRLPEYQIVILGVRNGEFTLQRYLTPSSLRLFSELDCHHARPGNDSRPIGVACRSRSAGQ